MHPGPRLSGAPLVLSLVVVGAWGFVAPCQPRPVGHVRQPQQHDHVHSSSSGGGRSSSLRCFVQAPPSSSRRAVERTLGHSRNARSPSLKMDAKEGGSQVRLQPVTCRPYMTISVTTHRLHSPPARPVTPTLEYIQHQPCEGVQGSSSMFCDPPAQYASFSTKYPPPRKCFQV